MRDSMRPFSRGKWRLRWRCNIRKPAGCHLETWTSLVPPSIGVSRNSHSVRITPSTQAFQTIRRGASSLVISLQLVQRPGTFARKR